jgi:hypothetical protein
MTVFMFWNTKGASLYDEIDLIFREYDVDIAIFAESALNPLRLLTTLNRDVSSYFYELPALGNRLQFFTRYPSERVEPRFDSSSISMRLLKHPLGDDVLIVAVHLPSKRHYTEHDQAHHARLLIMARLTRPFNMPSVISPKASACSRKTPTGARGRFSSVGIFQYPVIIG